MKMTYVLFTMFFAINLYSNTGAKQAMAYQKCVAKGDLQNKIIKKCTGANAGKNTKECKKLQIAIQECACKHLKTGCEELEKAKKEK